MSKFVNASAAIVRSNGPAICNLEQFWDKPLLGELDFDWCDPTVDGKVIEIEYDGASFGKLIADCLTFAGQQRRSGLRIVWNSDSGDGCHFTNVESTDDGAGRLEVVVRHVSLDGGGHGNLFDQPIMIVRGKFDFGTCEWSDVELCQQYDGKVCTDIIAHFEPLTEPIV